MQHTRLTKDENPTVHDPINSLGEMQYVVVAN